MKHTTEPTYAQNLRARRTHNRKRINDNVKGTPIAGVKSPARLAKEKRRSDMRAKEKANQIANDARRRAQQTLAAQQHEARVKERAEATKNQPQKSQQQKQAVGPMSKRLA